jgi:hypothetical protein
MWPLLTAPARPPVLLAAATPCAQFTFGVGVFTFTRTHALRQPGATIQLDAGDLTNGRSYGATHHNGTLYVAMVKPYGATNDPSVYWAYVDVGGGGDLCAASRTQAGVVTSKIGLDLAYPQIAPTSGGGALLVYSYSGPSSAVLPGSLGLPYAGAARGPGRRPRVWVAPILAHKRRRCWQRRTPALPHALCGSPPTRDAVASRCCKRRWRRAPSPHPPQAWRRRRSRCRAAS